MPRDNRIPSNEPHTPGGKGPGPLHKCPRHGCTAQIRADKLMCSADWTAVPKPLRDEVWKAWDRGRGASTPAHRAAMDAAIAAVNEKLAVA